MTNERPAMVRRFVPLILASLLIGATSWGCKAESADQTAGEQVPAQTVETVPSIAANDHGIADRSQLIDEGAFLVTTDAVDQAKVKNVVEARKLLEPCRKKPCKVIQIETCDRCYIQAGWAGKGYAIAGRRGPPAIYYTAIKTSDKKLLAVADKDFDPDEGGSRFTFDETLAMLLGYMGYGEEPTNFTWRETDLLPDDEEPANSAWREGKLFR